jgi:hypothetical protein
MNRIVESHPLAPPEPGSARLRTARHEVFARVLARGLPALGASPRTRHEASATEDLTDDSPDERA